ncbi:hypothetical protein Tcan_01078, partial [Toxocara canis]
MFLGDVALPIATYGISFQPQLPESASAIAANDHIIVMISCVHFDSLQDYAISNIAPFNVEIHVSVKPSNDSLSKSGQMYDHCFPLKYVPLNYHILLFPMFVALSVAGVTAYSSV